MIFAPAFLTLLVAQVPATPDAAPTPPAVTEAAAPPTPAVSATPTPAAAAPTSCAIAILDFQKGKAGADTAKVLADALAIDLEERTSCRIITAGDIRNMAEFESLRQNLGCDEGACLAELGGALGVERVVSGDLVVLNAESLVINARLADVNSATVVGRANITAGRSPEDTRAAAPRVARALLGIPEPDVAVAAGPPLAAFVVGGVGVGVAALGGAAVAFGEVNLANAEAKAADKEGALLASRVGLAVVGTGIVGVVIGAVLFAVGGES